MHPGVHISTSAVRRHLLEAGRKAKKPLESSLLLQSEEENIRMGKSVNAGLSKTRKKCCFQMKVISSSKGSTEDLSGSGRVSS